MTRFDELNQLFDPWRQKWIDLSHKYRMLPFAIAGSFQRYLGCPETFKDGDPVSPKVERYVAPASADWNEKSRHFNLVASKGATAELTFHEDGFFYFGIRVCLEHGPNVWPKEAFWFLLRAHGDEDKITVRVQRSGEEFDLKSSDSLQSDALCEHLFQLLKEDLAKSPIGDPERVNKMGFMA
jgi:hypothetical protein